MYLTHQDYLCTDQLTLIDDIPYPQYVHQALPNSLVTDKGIKTVPEALVAKTITQATKDVIARRTARTRAGFFLATGGNIWTGYYPNIKRSDRYPTHKVLPLGMTQIYAGKLANQLGSFDYITVDSSTCVSGHSAWQRAKMMIDAGMLDMAVVVSVDNGISEEYLHIFGTQGISKLAKDEEDSSVEKFHLGQGCHIGVFESHKALAKHYHNPIAAIHHITVKAEMHTNPLGMTAIGTGYRNVLKSIDTSKVDFVKTHGTYTEENRVEERVIREVCGDVPLVNYKLKIGHTMGPSTAIETALAIEEYQGKFVSLGAGMGNVFSGATVEIFE